MALSESDRLSLHAATHEWLGEEADLLMDALFSDPERMATSDDVALLGSDLRAEMADLRTELRAEMADLRTEMAELRTDLRTEMAELRTDLRTEMAELRTDLRTEMATLGSDLRAEFHEATTGQTRTLLFGLVGTVVSMSTVQLVSLVAIA